MQADIDSAILAKTSLFETLDAGDRDLLALVMNERHLAAGDVLFEVSSPGDSVAIVVDGELEARVDRGEAISIGQYEFVGEMTCIDPAPRSATVVARSDARIAMLDRKTLMMLRSTAPRVYSSIVRAITQRVTDGLRKTNEMIEARYPASTYSRPRSRTTGSDSERFGGKIDLRELFCLRDFSASELSLLAAVARYRRYPGGAVLCEEGDASDTCYIVAEGEVEVRKTISNLPCVLGSIERGALLGQSSLIDHKARSATLVARNQVVTVEITRENFEKLRAACTPLAIRFQELLGVSSVRQLRMATERLRQIPQYDGPSLDSLSEDTVRDESVVFATEGSEEGADAHTFVREDTVRRFLDSALVESGLTLDELDEIDFEDGSDSSVA